ncbi:MAG: hypothetical protein ACD_56C00016G0003 [uncultured bacterium]|nr:MAG: hypothetical protein ACD_56C00016G0003 [uncultured bacterium]
MGIDEDNKEYDFEATLVFIVEGRRVLLALKKLKIGKGRFNGYGGAIELTDNSIEAAAAREFFQECGCRIKEDRLRKVAEAYFTNVKSDGGLFVCKVHVFLLKRRHCKGTPVASGEMGKPQWFKKKMLPENMMVADRYWIPEIFKRKKLIVKATMQKSQSELLDLEIAEVKSF